MLFTVEKSEIEKIKVWKENLDKKRIQKQKDNMSAEEFELRTKDGTYPYAGSGELTYSFSNTSLGCVLKVTDEFSGEVLDLTDYESW